MTEKCPFQNGAKRNFHGGVDSKVGLALLCPITQQAKGYPFEVQVPPGLKVAGVVLSDHIKSLDWNARGAAFVCALPAPVVREVLGKAGTLLTP